MKEYIDKYALVQEIEKHYNECRKRAKIIDYDYWDAKADAYLNVLVILNDIVEPKEVDLEKVFLDEYSKFSNDTDAMDYAFLIDLAGFRGFVKHFFELGVKERKEE